MNQNDELCGRCANIDTQALLSSTPSKPYRPWQVADIVDSAATTACTFCCLIVDTLQPVTVDGNDGGYNSTLTDKALSSVQSIQAKSKRLSRFLAPKIKELQRDRDGWIEFTVLDRNDVVGSISRISISVTGSKHRRDSNEKNKDDQEAAAEFILAPGPGMPTDASSLITGILQRSTTQTRSHLTSAIQSWRQHCHDTHECWKPLSQRRNREVGYFKELDGQITRRDWYTGPDNLPPVESYELPPLELEAGRLDVVALPSRVLEIVPSATDNGQCSFWLRETGGAVGKYVILSHRWVADTERVRTLKSNYDVRVGRLPASDDDDDDDETRPPIAPGDVTKVFQEAAQTAVHLGIKYIWIDSLCIVQDDPDDWKHEAAKMASYYQNAWLTIAGCSGEGLFHPIDTALLPPILHLPYTSSTGERAGHLSLQPVSNPHLRSLYTQAITHSELLSRGWVFQEWFLSTRIAIFSPTAGVFLVCSEASPQSALLNDTVHDDGSSSKHRSSAPDKSFKQALDISLVGPPDISDSWRRLVEAYSGLQLTQLASDRLIALAGIAKEVGDALQQTIAGQKFLDHDDFVNQSYLCGLWGTQLDRGLQWEVLDRSQPLARIPGFPSWTWASLGRVVDGSAGQQRMEGVPVRWHTQWRRLAAPWFTLKEVRRFEDGTDETQQPTTELPMTAPASDFGILNRRLALCVKGQLVRNFRLEESWPGGQADLDRIADKTANRLIGIHYGEQSLGVGRGKGVLYTSDAWHRVTTLKDGSSSAFGWASLDSANLRVENTEDGPWVVDEGNGGKRALYAFRLSLSHRVHVDSAWYQNDEVDIFVVLFVVEVDTRIADEPCFERVGVGRMVKAGILDSVRDLKLKRQRFWLV